MFVAVFVMIEAILIMIELVMALSFRVIAWSPVIVLVVSGFSEIVILMFDLVLIFEILVIAVVNFRLDHLMTSRELPLKKCY